MCGQPWWLARSWSVTRPECVMRTVVTPACSWRSKVTSVSVAFSYHEGSHVNASTLGGSIVRYTPPTLDGLPPQLSKCIIHLPPGRRSDSIVGGACGSKKKDPGYAEVLSMEDRDWLVLCDFREARGRLGELLLAGSCQLGKFKRVGFARF